MVNHTAQWYRPRGALSPEADRRRLRGPGPGLRLASGRVLATEGLRRSGARRVGRRGHHLRQIRADDVDIDYPAVMGSRERLWALIWRPLGVAAGHHDLRGGSRRPGAPRGRNGRQRVVQLRGVRRGRDGALRRASTSIHPARSLRPGLTRSCRGGWWMRRSAARWTRRWRRSCPSGSRRRGAFAPCIGSRSACAGSRGSVSGGPGRAPAHSENVNCGLGRRGCGVAWPDPGRVGSENAGIFRLCVGVPTKDWRLRGSAEPAREGDLGRSSLSSEQYLPTVPLRQRCP